MLATSSCQQRRATSRSRTEELSASSTGSRTPLARYPSTTKLPLKFASKDKPTTSPDSYASLGRIRRMRSRKMNGLDKLDSARRKPFNYTELAYREAVSKLKYLLAESFTSRTIPRRAYQDSNLRINESGDDTDDRSVTSDTYKGKSCLFKSKYYSPKHFHLKPPSSNVSPFPNGDTQTAPPEVMSYIEQQEEYIQQLERESQYCRNELANLLGKVREVIAENEKLHDKNFIKSMIEEVECDSDKECHKLTLKSPTQVSDTKRSREFSHRSLECPNIVYESRISELEAQLTQTKIELKKCQEENQAHLQKLSESCTKTDPEMKIHMDQILRDKRELELKLEDLRRDFSCLRDRETDLVLKAKRAVDLAHQADYEKNYAQSEIKRLMDELDKRNEKLREACQDANRRVMEEKQQIERRFSQQMEQLSADVASQWEVANKSQLESEKQRREILELKREMAQKQAIIDDLRKELQNKTSSLQSDLTRMLFEKDAAEQEISSAKSLAERIERQGRQEQNRLQSEINSYKMRLERADADLIHCRRENFRLSDQISSLEKEINLSKMAEDSRTTSSSPKNPSEKELASMVLNMESKHAATVAALEGALANQATLVSRLTAECQSLTQRLEDNDLKHKYKPVLKHYLKDEMASLQNNIKYLSNKVQETLRSQQDTPNRTEPFVDEKKFPTESSQSKLGQPFADNLTQEQKEAAGSEMQQDYSKGNEQLKSEDNYQQQGEEQGAQQQYFENQGNFENQDYSQYGQYDTSQYQQYGQDGQYAEQPYEGMQYNEQEYPNYPQEVKEYEETRPEETK